MAKKLSVILFVGLFGFFSLSFIEGLLSRGSSERTDKELRRTEAYNREARATLRALSDALNGTGDEISRAGTELENSSGLNKSIKDGARTCSELVEVLRADNRKAEQLITELIRGTEKRETSSDSRNN